MIINLKNLFIEQQKLDKEIQINHNINYAETRNKRLLAFLVELGEFSNSTRCFKFWSNKESEEKERVLDEFVDALHFILSIGVDLGFETKEIEFNESNDELSNHILSVYNDFIIFMNDKTYENYINCFSNFLGMATVLKFTSDDILESYYKKLKVNYQRQETNY